MSEKEFIQAPAGGFALPPVHPGEILAEEIEARGMNAHSPALRLRVPANRIGAIMAGKRGLTAETALRIGRHFGTGAAFWMTLQSQYALAIALRDMGERIAAEVAAA